MKWTERHQREALVRTYELAAELAKQGDWICAGAIAGHAYDWAATETGWRENLSVCFSSERVDAEVELVHQRTMTMT